MRVARNVLMLATCDIDPVFDVFLRLNPSKSKKPRSKLRGIEKQSSKLKFLTIWGLKSAVNADEIRD